MPKYKACSSYGFDQEFDKYDAACEALTKEYDLIPNHARRLKEVEECTRGNLRVWVEKVRPEQPKTDTIRFDYFLPGSLDRPIEGVSSDGGEIRTDCDCPDCSRARQELRSQRPGVEAERYDPNYVRIARRPGVSMRDFDDAMMQMYIAPRQEVTYTPLRLPQPAPSLTTDERWWLNIDWSTTRVQTIINRQEPPCTTEPTSLPAPDASNTTPTTPPNSEG